MIETRRLKNVVIFIQTILSFVLSRKIINIYNDIARKYGNVTVKDFQKIGNNNKLKPDIHFLNNCKQLGVYPKFLIFKVPKVFSSANNKRNKKLQHFSQKLSLFKNFFLKQLSTIDFYILTKSITSQTINRCRNRYTLNKKRYLQ